MLREAVRREYDGWAPALARVLTRVAGVVHPPRAREWMADVLYLQLEGERRAGLWEAFSYLLGAPGLTARALAGRRDGRTVTDGRTVSIPPHLTVGDGGFGPGFAGWVRHRAEVFPLPRDMDEAIALIGNRIAGDAQVVSFVRDEDGVLLGLEVSGAEVEGVLTTPAVYSRRRERIEARGVNVRLVDETMMAALDRLADVAARLDRNGWTDRTLTVVLAPGCRGKGWQEPY